MAYTYGRTPNVLQPVEGTLHHLAPIPVYYRQLEPAEAEPFNEHLIAAAKAAMEEPILDVPDVRHIHDLGSPPSFADDSWTEDQPLAAVGVWHQVPTNSFLDLPAEPVRRLRALIESAYAETLAKLGSTDEVRPWISESWIQFYKDGDYKVLHNHAPYGPQHRDDPWAGAYYMADGDPDSTMPYSGVFSFRVRESNYFIRPRAGLLMMWPADVLHEVHPFYGASQRVVVNWNINRAAG